VPPVVVLKVVSVMAREVQIVEIFYPVVKFFTSGGVFMFPILLVAAVATAIAVERYVTLTRLSARNRSAWARVEPVLASGDFDKAREMTSKDDAGVSRLLNMGLALQGAVRRRDDVEKAMQESMMEIIPQLEKRTHYLATFANLATLLGLLGTVSGLIHAFGAVATVNPAEKANLLSSSISEAMNCTAFGLMTAVPILFVHAFLQTRTIQVVDGLETAAIKYLNALAARQAARAQSRLELVQAGQIGQAEPIVHGVPVAHAAQA
jgi:biopolymer transport protein ExbB